MIMAHILVHGEGMRKPVCLAVLGISIVVAAVSLGVTLTRYLGLRAYSPGGAAQAGTTPAGRAVPVTPPEQWTNLFAPGDGMKLASRLPAVNAKTGSQVAALQFRPRRDDRILHPFRPPGDPLGKRHEGAEGVPRKGRGRARGDPFLRRTGQGVDHAREGTGKTGDPPRGKPCPRDGDGIADRRRPRSPPRCRNRPFPPARLPVPGRRPHPACRPTGRKRWWSPPNPLPGKRTMSTSARGNGAGETVGSDDDGTRRC